MSASGSAMWLACPPSARLNDTVKDKGGADAALGTLAHELAENRLRRRLTVCDSETRRALDAQFEDTRLTDDRCDREMELAIESYVEEIEAKLLTAKARSADAILLLEEKVDYSEWAPDGFGSCDVIIIADGLMDVIDFKYGTAQRRGQLTDAALRPGGLKCLQLPV